MEEDAVNQGMWTASRSWMRQGDFPLELPEEHSPADILVFYVLISYHKLSGLKQQQAYYVTIL